MKTIGVLGIGAAATMDFEERVHHVAQRLNPQPFGRGEPPMIVYYVRDPPFVLQADGRPVFPLQPHPGLLAAASRLGAWADFLVMTANGPHMIHDEIVQAAGRPILSLIAVTLAEVTRRRPQRVGVFGYLGADVYTRPLGQMGQAFVTIDSPLQADVDAAVRALWEERAGSPPHAGVSQAVADLRGQGADLIILGCTELPLLLGSEADTAPDLLNPAQLLADAAVRQALA